MAKQAATQRAPRPVQNQQRRVEMVDVARIAAIVAGVAALVTLLWFARTALLLLFAGILLAVLLDGMSRPLMRWTGMPKPAAVALVVLGIALFFLLVAWSAGPVLLQQLEEVGRSITATITNLGQEAASQAGQNEVLRHFDWSDLVALLPSPLGLASGATAVASSIIGVMTSLLIVIFFGVYFALTPELYLNLILRFAPVERRKELRAMFDEIGTVLHHWLRGQLLAMTVVGSLTFVGLLLLGIPLAFALGLLLGMFEFIPYIGPIIGAAPMLLVGAGQGMDVFLWVAGLYLVVQLLESYVLTPLIQSHAVSLPPVVVILSQLVLGAMFGVLGLALATPLVAAAAVPLRRYLGTDIRS